MAGFLTAVLSYVKLVNDKEGRTTDYRQNWTNSVRTTLAELASKIEVLLELFNERAKRLERLSELTKKIDELNGNSQNDRDPTYSALEHHKGLLENVNREIIKTKHDIYSAYALAQLHFKLDDEIFPQIEAKFKEVTFHLESINQFAQDTDKIKMSKERVSQICGEIIYSSRMLLKKEWEIIKRGESTYQISKKMAIWGGVVFLSIFLILSTIYFNTSEREIVAIKKAVNSNSERDLFSNIGTTERIQLAAIHAIPMNENITNNCVISISENKSQKTISQKQVKENLHQDFNAGFKNQSANLVDNECESKTSENKLKK